MPRFLSFLFDNESRLSSFSVDPKRAAHEARCSKLRAQVPPSTLSNGHQGPASTFYSPLLRFHRVLIGFLQLFNDLAVSHSWSVTTEEEVAAIVMTNVILLPGEVPQLTSNATVIKVRLQSLF